MFLVVGNGNGLYKVKEFAKNLNIQDNVIFTGDLSFNNLIQAYKSADIYVLPSLSEGLPTTILEAFYFNIPVVATDIPGVRDHFNKVALLVPPKNEVELAKAIVRYLKNEKFAKRLSSDGKKLVTNNYTCEKVAKEYEILYKSICK